MPVTGTTSPVLASSDIGLHSVGVETTGEDAYAVLEKTNGIKAGSGLWGTAPAGAED